MVGGRACLSVSELKPPSIMTFEHQSALCALTSFTGLSSIFTFGHPSFLRLLLANHGLTRSFLVSGCNTYHITGHHVITHEGFSRETMGFTQVVSAPASRETLVCLASTTIGYIMRETLVCIRKTAARHKRGE